MNSKMKKTTRLYCADPKYYRILQDNTKTIKNSYKFKRKARKLYAEYGVCLFYLYEILDISY